MLHSLLFVALAGTKLVQNDNFTGTGTVNSAVSFLEYEGPAVLFRPDSGYPLTVRWIDVLSVTYNQGAPGVIAAYQLDVWDERGGRIDPPQKVDGGRYAPIFTNNFELTTQTTAFNRIELTPPMVVSSGGVFVSLGENLSTMDDDATVAIDTAPLKPGANWYRSGSGTFSQLELPDAGFLRGISHNWIIRLVLEVPDMPVTVTSVFPSSGVSTAPTPIVITGTNFELGAQAFVGTTSLTITGSVPPTNIQATVPPGLAPGRYDVKVQNPGGASGVLTNGFEVLLGDGGSGTGGGAGGGSGGAGGGGGTGGGGAPGVLLLDDITPADGYNEETTKVVLTGTGFQDGAQVLIGPSVLDVVTVKSSAVINAEIAPGLTQGIYDVTVINLDGERSKLRNAFTMNAGTRTKSGCGCGSSGLEPLALALVLAAWRGRYRRRRPGVQ